MKNTRLLALVALPLAIGGLFFGVRALQNSDSAPPAREIRWLTMNEALAANQKEKKMFFIDVYTDWCGWCKVMDRETFAKPEVAQLMNEHFYCVKLNSEKEAEEIVVDGKRFGLVDAGNRKIHTLAYALLDGRLSYPSYVYLNENLDRVRISAGYKEVQPFMAEVNEVVQVVKNNGGSTGR